MLSVTARNTTSPKNKSRKKLPKTTISKAVIAEPPLKSLKALREEEMDYAPVEAKVKLIFVAFLCFSQINLLDIFL